MKSNSIAKSYKRIVMYVPNELRDEMKEWVGNPYSTLSDLGREAFRYYLSTKKKEERNRQLTLSCKEFYEVNHQIATDWRSTDSEYWP